MAHNAAAAVDGGGGGDGGDWLVLPGIPSVGLAACASGGRHIFLVTSTSYCAGLQADYRSGVPTMIKYDAVWNSWSVPQPMAKLHVGGALAHVGGHLYAAGGLGGFMKRSDDGFLENRILQRKATAATARYEPGAGELRSVRSMHRPRIYCQGVDVGGKLFVVGGVESAGRMAPIHSLEVFDPTTATWGVVDAPWLATVGAQSTVAAAGATIFICHARAFGAQAWGDEVCHELLAYDTASRTVSSMPVELAAEEGYNLRRCYLLGAARQLFLVASWWTPASPHTASSRYVHATVESFCSASRRWTRVSRLHEEGVDFRILGCCVVTV
eukprot:SM000156S02113  [mRNA]  locus=s156:16891:18036:+ [translate_table: standard]